MGRERPTQRRLRFRRIDECIEEQVPVSLADREAVAVADHTVGGLKRAVHRKRDKNHRRPASEAYDLPAVSRRKANADSEGVSTSSDSGLVLRAAERQLGLDEALDLCIRAWRDPQSALVNLGVALTHKHKCRLTLRD